ncbi:hypothetical protein QBC45DRAFT_334949, partial [Copromyces sp. CBS 386.78]
INYKLFFKGRSFMFNVKYSLVVNTIIDVKILIVAFVKNNTEGIITINKRFNIGTIIENIEGVFFYTL